MTTSMGRTALVLMSSAGLMAGTAVSAAASVNDDHPHRDRSGYVQVCQVIREDGHQGLASRRDDPRFDGRYRVRDSDNNRSTVRLHGRRACSDRIRVHTGDVRVRVLDKPNDTRLRSGNDQSVRVRRGETKRVTFRYVEDD